MNSQPHAGNKLHTDNWKHAVIEMRTHDWSERGNLVCSGLDFMMGQKVTLPGM
jgi:hypothetical protein